MLYPSGASNTFSAGGGVASPTDRIDSTQFSEQELRAAVEEATAANIPVMAHAYTARAINRALDCGVTSIEAETADGGAELGRWLTVRLEVVRSFKGAANIEYLSVRTARSSAACGLPTM